MDTLNDGDVRRLKFTIEQQQAQLKKLDDQIVSRKRELQTLDEALRLALIASQKRRFS
jgi:cell division protein FtsB